MQPGIVGIANPGAHGFSEILYAFTSAGSNNGSGADTALLRRAMIRAVRRRSSSVNYTLIWCAHRHA